MLVLSRKFDKSPKCEKQKRKNIKNTVFLSSPSNTLIYFRLLELLKIEDKKNQKIVKLKGQDHDSLGHHTCENYMLNHSDQVLTGKATRNLGVL
jgi:hypothetical protein